MAAEQQAIYYATALYDYTGNSDVELSFYAGDTIEILEDRDAEWSYGRLNGYTGCLPRNYIQVLDDNSYYAGDEYYDGGGDEILAAKKAQKTALEKEIAELEKRKNGEEEALSALSRMGGDTESVFYDLTRLMLLLEFNIDTETELRAATQVLQNELNNLKGVLQSCKPGTQFDLQKKKAEEKLDKMIQELQSSDGNFAATNASRTDVTTVIQKVISSIKV